MAIPDGVKIDRIVDARGSFCPGPLMEMIRAVKAAQVGEVIAVLTTESGSKHDVPAWAEKAGQELIGVFEDEGFDQIVIRKKK